VLNLAGVPEWRRLSITGQAPPAVGYCTAALDPGRDEMIVMSAQSGSWKLSLGDPHTWTPIYASGNYPSSRFPDACTYDPAGDRLVVFGGYSSLPLSNDVWALTLGASPFWTALAVFPGGSRYQSSVVYDANHSRVLVFGGLPLRGPTSGNDAWS